MFDFIVSFLTAKVTNKSNIVKFYRIVIVSIGCFFRLSKAWAWYFTLSKSMLLRLMHRILLLYMVR